MTTAVPGATSPKALPYKIAWGAELETIDTSFAVPEGSALEDYIEHCFGYLLGSSRLGDREADVWLLKAGAARIRSIATPTPAHRQLILFLLINVPAPYKAAIIRWGLNRVFDPEITQPFLLTAWRLWHHMVMHAAGWDIRRVIEWFIRARFDDPRGQWVRSIVQLWTLDDRMTIYRGGWGVRPEELAQGLSWTPNKVVAAFFATRFRRGGGSDAGVGPVILSREISRGDILMSVGLSPAEIVVAPSDSWACGTEPQGWEAMGRSYEAIRDHLLELAKPEFGAMFHEAPDAKLDLFLNAVGKTREQLEQAIGRKVRLATAETGGEG